MADKDLEGDGPSLELPSFGFGRKKKAKQSEPAAPVEPLEDTTPPVEPEPEPLVVEPEPVVEPVPEPEPVVEPEPTPPLAPELDPVTPEPQPTPAVPEAVTMKVATEPEAEAEAPRDRREFSLPAIPALQAALAVGAVIGLFAVLLTFASLKLCELVRGTDSCGGPGLLLLVATLVILTYVGGWLLRAFGIDDPGSTSFLAVGLLAVMAMLFFLDVIYNWWMVIVIPIVAMATYALSWWVTTRFVDID